MDVTEAIVRVARYETHKEQIRNTLVNFIRQHGGELDKSYIAQMPASDIQLARIATRIRDHIADQETRYLTEAIDAVVKGEGLG
jgi:hypothetical protein